MSEDNLNFFWDTSTKTLKLGNKNYNFASAGWGGFSYFQIANRDTPYVIPNNGTGYGSKIDFYSTSTSGFTQTSGIRVRANVATSGGSTPVVTGVESFVTNSGSTTTTDLLQGVEGIASVIENTARVAGGWFQANASSGGSGNTIGESTGVRSIISSYNQYTITDAMVFWGTGGVSNGPVVNLYGLRLDNWTGSAVTNSYGIYLDNSIDRGTTSRYAFYSTSTSRSLFSGTVALANGAAVASAGTISITGNVFHVTGTTNITSISGTNVNAGTEVILIFDASVTVTNGSNLKLAGDFSATANDTMKLVYDGTNWYEVSRSINT